MSKIIENIKSRNYEVVDNKGVSITAHFTQYLEKEFADLEAKLAEKDKEIEKYRNANIIVVGGRSQGKKHLMEIKIKEIQNQKAIEQLEKVKKFVNEIYGEYSASITTNFIDNQINELKGKVEDDTNKQ